MNELSYIMYLKRTLRDKISDCIFSYRKCFKSRLFNKRNCRIFMYHSIENSNLMEDTMGLAVTPETFYMHMKYLKDNEFYVMDLLELAGNISNGLSIPEKSIVITFDDGFKSVWTNALPILKEFNFTASLFVNISFLERNLPENYYWNNWQTLNWEEIKQLRETGLTIGSHGFTHRKFTELSNRELKKEIADSRKLIEKKIEGKIYALSYPHGAFNNNVKKFLKDNNFFCACSSIEGINSDQSDIFALRRTEITAFDDTRLRFEKKILGSHDWLRFVRFN